MSIATATTRPPFIRYDVDVAVTGAPARKRRFVSFSILPTLLSLQYVETADGWVVNAATISGPRITKAGTGARYEDRLWTSDLSDEEQWIRDAIREYAPKGSLR